MKYILNNSGKPLQSHTPRPSEIRSRSGARYRFNDEGALIRIDAKGKAMKQLKAMFPSNRQRKRYIRTLMGKPRHHDHPAAISELERQLTSGDRRPLQSK